jgi:transcriptional regulator GlxA family with amidase domain
MHYVRRQRLEHAAELLRATQSGLEEIARLSG